MRDWDNLLEPEATKGMVEKFMKKEEIGEDKLETHLEFESSSGKAIDDVKENIENRINDFIVGGCMPEGDGEIKCKFNLRKVTGVGGPSKLGRERPRATFKGAVLSIEDADQTKSSNSKIGKVPSGLAIVSNNGLVFCQSKNKKLICDRFERPKGVMLLKKVVEDGVLTAENKVIDLDRKERIKTDSIKFPTGGKVFADKKKDLVNITL